MTEITSQELSYLRSHPHKTHLWLSIYRPKTMMAARVTGSYTTGDFQISYYGVTTGTYTNMYADMTVLVGSQAGQDDVGRIRMRAVTGSYVVFAENGLQWQTGQHLTFIDYITIEAIYPRIIPDPNNAVDVIFYKDYNIPYSNQNTLYGSFPCAGPHRAGFIQSGTASIFYSATGTYNVAGSALSYSWLFEGGTPTGSTSIIPGNVTYSTPGHYRTRLRVTAANGAVDDTYRYVSLYNRPNEGTQIPTLRWELQELSGSRDQGGYTASFRLFENIGEVEPNALVVIFADTWYGGTKVGLGGNASGNSSIIFVGYILSDSIKFNYKESYVEFQVGSVSEMMKSAEGFAVSCESKSAPATWFELQEMTVPKAMYHYLRWHSTVLKTTDFQYTGDDRLVQYFDSDRGSLYDAVDSFMRDGMLGAVVSDRQSKLWAEVQPYGLEAPMSAIPQTFTIHKQDWIGTPNIQERRGAEMSFIELGGIAYYGVSSNSFSALLSNAPSTVPLYHGKSDSPHEGLILVSQSQLNNVSGNYLAFYNSRFPEISFSMSGNYLNFDIAPLNRMGVNIASGDSIRGKSLQDLQYFIDAMEWNYDSEREIFRPDMTIKQIATGTAGQTVLIPAVPPNGGYETDNPDFDLPPLPTFGNTPSVGPTTNTAVIFHDLNHGFVYSSNFDSASPNYITVNGGLTEDQYTNANFMFVCPNGAFYVGHASHIPIADIGTGDPDSPFLARAPAVGQPFVILEDEDTIYAKYSSVADSSIALKACSFNALLPETVAYILTGDDTTIDHSYSNIYVGSGGTFTQGALVERIASNLGDNGLSFGVDTWVYSGPRAQLFSPSATWKFNAAGTSLIGVDGNTFGSISEASHYRPSPNLRTMFSLGWSTGKIKKSIDNGDNWTDLGDTDMHGGEGIAMDPTGLYGMLRYGAGNKGRTTDGLASVTLLPNLPVGSSYVFGYAGSVARWIAAYTIIRLTDDGGSSWRNKEGDYLTVIDSIPRINMIFVPGFGQTHAQTMDT